MASFNQKYITLLKADWSSLGLQSLNQNKTCSRAGGIHVLRVACKTQEFAQAYLGKKQNQLCATGLRAVEKSTVGVRPKDKKKTKAKVGNTRAECCHRALVIL